MQPLYPRSGKKNLPLNRKKQMPKDILRSPLALYRAPGALLRDIFPEKGCFDLSSASDGDMISAQASQIYFGNINIAAGDTHLHSVTEGSERKNKGRLSRPAQTYSALFALPYSHLTWPSR